MFKMAVVLGGIAATCVLGAGIAAADDVEGGHCEYGDASVNLYPSCNTSGGEDEQILPPYTPNPVRPGLEQILEIFPGSF